MPSLRADLFRGAWRTLFRGVQICRTPGHRGLSRRTATRTLTRALSFSTRRRTTMSARRLVSVGSCVVGLLMAAGCGEGAADDVETNVGALTATSAANTLPPFTSAGSPGVVDGTTTWEVPTTPNALVTDQSWFSI